MVKGITEVASTTPNPIRCLLSGVTFKGWGFENFRIFDDMVQGVMGLDVLQQTGLIWACFKHEGSYMGFEF